MMKQKEWHAAYKSISTASNLSQYTTKHVGAAKDAF